MVESNREVINIENKIILIGGDHHNGLGLLRNLIKSGGKGLEVYGIIISDCQKSFISKSNYWKKTWIIRGENEVLNILRNIFVNEKFRPIIIPYSDGAEKIIDLNLDELKETYILPSIDNKQGAVVRLMNKWEQIRLAKEHNIPIADSYLLELKKLDYNLIEKFEYPCILKPVVSSEGNKLDISFCNNIEELKKTINIFIDKNYIEILVQKFIKKDFEILVIGCITPIKNKSMFCILKKLREWPLVGGTGSYYTTVISDDKIIKRCQEIISMLNKINYSGMFDIELFYKGNEIYLNEINFRNSGSGVISIDQEVFYPYVWCLNAIGKNTDNIKMYADCEAFYMNEFTDLRHVIYGNLPFRQWFSDLCKVNQLLVFDKYDMKPFWNRILYYIKQAMYRGQEQRKKAQK